MLIQKLFLKLQPYFPKLARYIGKRLGDREVKEFYNLKKQITKDVFSDSELIKDKDLIKEYKNVLVESNIVPTVDAGKTLIKRVIKTLPPNIQQNYKDVKTLTKKDIGKKISPEEWKKRSSKAVITKLENAKQEYEAVRDVILNASKEGKNLHLGEAYESLIPNLKSATKHGKIFEKFNNNYKKMMEVYADDPEVMNLLNFMAKQQLKYKAVTGRGPKSVSSAIHTSKIRKWKHMRDKFQQYFDDPLEAEHIMMRPDKYDLVDIGESEIAVRFREPDYLTTKARNTEKNNLVTNIKKNIFDKKELIKDLEFSLEQQSKGVVVNRTPETIKSEIAILDANIEAIGGRAENLGLQIAITDRPTGKIKYYGKPYESLVQLKKSLETEPFKDGGFASIEEVLEY